jgi:hypothetical protein
MKISIFLSFLFSLLLQQHDLFAQEFVLDFRENLVIGEADHDSLEYLFSGIRTIRPLPDGRILVADASEPSIRVFNQNGIFVKKIGQRGRGPGDFRVVTSIEIGNDESIIVLDRMQERISFFDHDGNYTHAHMLQGQTLGTLQFAFYRDRQNDFLLAYRDYMNAHLNGHYLHLYDQSFEAKESSHLDLFEHFFDSSKPFEIQVSLQPRYLATRYGVNHIAVVPKIYTGTIFSLDDHDLSERQIGAHINDFYTLHDILDSEKYFNSGMAGFGTTSGQHGRYLYRVKGTNIGLVGNSRFLLHFYVLHQDKDMIPYLTVYSACGKLLANISLVNFLINFIKNDVISIVPHFLDEENNLYTSDYYYMNASPAVRVFKTNLNELLDHE